MTPPSTSRRDFLSTPERIDAYRAAALTDPCLALYNSNAFLYVD